jgi:DnaK suppressor protein
MPAPAKKKMVTKKQRQAAARKKTARTSPDKAPVKTSPKGKKTVTVKKAEKKKVPPKVAAAKKAVPKLKGTRKKGQGKTAPSKDRLLELRKSLLRRKEQILREAKEEIAKNLSGENKQLVDTANDEGDWAQVDISEDISLQRLSAHRKLMHNIDEAIRKIAEGTYGICEECGEEISKKRLLVLPTATLCVDCQENKEQLEALETLE